MLVGSVAAWPVRSVARVPGVHMQLEADAADLEDGAGQGRPRPPGRARRRSSACPPRRRASAGVDPGLRAAAPDVGDGQRQRVGGVGRLRASRRAAGSGSPSRPTWALSARPLPETAALTSLGVCSATGSPRRAAHDQRDAAGLRGAHHRADVGPREHPLDRDRVGPVLVEPGVDAPLDASPAARRPAGRPRCARTPTSTSRSGRPTSPSTTPTPQRVRPGSIPSTRMGASAVESRSEQVFVRTLTAPGARTAHDTPATGWNRVRPGVDHHARSPRTSCAAPSTWSPPSTGCCRTGCPPGPAPSAPTASWPWRRPSPPAYGWCSAPGPPPSSWTRCAPRGLPGRPAPPGRRLRPPRRRPAGRRRPA